jgi:peptidoglycan hydrolase CwlO-like protein
MTPTLPPAIWAAILTIVFTGLFALIGVVYRMFKTDISDVENEFDNVDTRLTNAEKKVRTLFFWAFGHEQDSTDQGFAADIQAKLTTLNKKLDEMDDAEDEHHERVMERLDELILFLDDEEALEFERDDLD